MGKDTTRNKPVKVGDTRIITVESEGTLGDGVTRIGDTSFVIITKKAETKKTYEVLIQGVYNTYAIAKIIREVKDPKEINAKIDKEEDD